MLFDNTYQNLPKEFYERINPTPVNDPRLIIYNKGLASTIGIDKNISEFELTKIFAGNNIPIGSSPIALAYAGHQFGNFVNQLGDGRAILLGEICAPNKQRYDIQLKGSGQTKFSRQGDGRAPIGPVIREYVVSEAMSALGIPTTRSLAIVATGEKVFRETLIPGGILTRIAKSHIRVGTFEYFAAKGNNEHLKTLADYTINRHFSELKEASNPYSSLLRIVCNNQIELISQWMGVGFIHGVMNTDNTTLIGETIDYGPCAFMDEYNPASVFSSIDANGRYAFGNQPLIGQWNMACFANSLLPLIDKDLEKSLSKAQEIIDNFPNRMNEAIMKIMCSKIGFKVSDKDSQELLKNYLKLMLDNKSDYTLSFRYLSNLLKNTDINLLNEQFKDQESLTSWLKDWMNELKTKKINKKDAIKVMDEKNPIFIPRNHFLERTIEKAIKDNDYSEMQTLLEVLAKPFEEQPNYSTYIDPPNEDEVVQQTFCGT